MIHKERGYGKRTRVDMVGGKKRVCVVCERGQDKV